MNSKQYPTMNIHQQQNTLERTNQMASSHPTTTTAISTNSRRRSSIKSNDNNSIINSPSNLDIISGRGAGINLHPGNINFRHVAKSHRVLYKRARRSSEKRRIVKALINEMKSKGSRFLKLDTTKGKSSKSWVSLSASQIERKTSQALRDMKEKDEEISIPTLTENNNQSQQYNTLRNDAQQTIFNHCNQDFQFSSNEMDRLRSVYLQMLSLRNQQIDILKMKQRQLEDEQQQLFQNIIGGGFPVSPVQEYNIRNNF
jgi:hypothetical protein